MATWPGHADGIAVNADSVALSGNIANANGIDGIVTLLAVGDTLTPAKVTGNVANDNTARGLNISAGDTDGGSNKASGNGNQHQCENVVCSCASVKARGNGAPSDGRCSVQCLREPGP